MIILLIIFLLFPNIASAETNHIVISEIQVYGQTAKDEFIKLYNPTNNSINVSNWKLSKKTASGSESNLVSSFAEGTIIPAHSDFLITHKTDYQGTQTANYTYSGASYSVAINNTVILKNNEDIVIDKVGFGEAIDFENTPTNNPENGQSIKRINNEDTDNNKNDFTTDQNNIQEPTTNPTSNMINNQDNNAVSSFQFGDILINRILPNPLEGKEWIELYNTKNTPIDLTNWHIADGASKIYDLSGVIDDYIIIEVNNRLNNSGDTISIADNTNQTIDIITYGNWYDGNLEDNWATPEKGEILTRENQNIKIEKNTTTSTISTILKTTIQPDQYNTDITSIQISEILPNPVGSDTEGEWIELYNSSTSTDINIGGFYLDDNDGGSRPYKIPSNTIIKAGSFILFDRNKTKLALNNDYDAVRILDKNQEELLNIEYENGKEGLSYININNTWSWTSSPTPLNKNIKNNTVQVGTTSTTNYITDIVVVPPNIFSTQTMYINGKQLYMYKADWPDLKTGDKISVWGEPSTYYNEPRLKLKNKYSIKIISQNNILEPLAITADDITDDLIGKYITMEGEVLEVQSSKIFMDIEGVEISINKKGNIKFPQVKERDVIKISGILSKYKDDFRVLPTKILDMQILTTNITKDIEEVEKQIPTWYYTISTLVFIGLVGGITITRRRKNDRTKTTEKTTLS